MNETESEHAQDEMINRKRTHEEIGEGKINQLNPEADGRLLKRQRIESGEDEQVERQEHTEKCNLMNYGKAPFGEFDLLFNSENEVLCECRNQKCVIFRKNLAKVIDEIEQNAKTNEAYKHENILEKALEEENLGMNENDAEAILLSTLGISMNSLCGADGLPVANETNEVSFLNEISNNAFSKLDSYRKILVADKLNEAITGFFEFCKEKLKDSENKEITVDILREYFDNLKDKKTQP